MTYVRQPLYCCNLAIGTLSLCSTFIRSRGETNCLVDSILLIFILWNRKNHHGLGEQNMTHDDEGIQRGYIEVLWNGLPSPEVIRGGVLKDSTAS